MHKRTKQDECLISTHIGIDLYTTDSAIHIGQSLDNCKAYTETKQLLSSRIQLKAGISNLVVRHQDRIYRWSWEYDLANNHKDQIDPSHNTRSILDHTALQGSASTSPANDTVHQELNYTKKSRRNDDTISFQTASGWTRYTHAYSESAACCILVANVGLTCRDDDHCFRHGYTQDSRLIIGCFFFVLIT